MKLTPCRVICISWIAMLTGLLAPQSVIAGDYTFEIPQLLGNYPEGGNRNVELVLGIDFAEIESASLQLNGTQVLGSYSDLNFPGTFPLSAAIDALFELPGIAEFVFADQILPAVNGVFLFDEEFQASCCSTDLDFTPWLDGIAEFQFRVGAPVLVGTSFVTSKPGVNIDSAILVIQGQVEGDLDGDGDVDGNDFLLIQRTDPSLIPQWQSEYGTSTAVASSQAVPEPSTLILFAVFAAIACLRRTAGA